MKIGFNARGSRKIGGSKGEDIYLSVVALRQILADGIVIETAPDRAGRDNVKAVHKIGASVAIAGRTVDLIATVREMSDGTFHYDLSKDAEGEAKSFSGLTAPRELRASALEGDLADGNVDFASDDIKADEAVPVSAMREITASLNKKLAKSGLAGKVYPILVRRLLGISGVEIAGRQQGQLGVWEDIRHLSRDSLVGQRIWFSFDVQGLDGVLDCAVEDFCVGEGHCSSRIHPAPGANSWRKSKAPIPVNTPSHC